MSLELFIVWSTQFSDVDFTFIFTEEYSCLHVVMSHMSDLTMSKMFILQIKLGEQLLIV